MEVGGSSLGNGDLAFAGITCDLFRDLGASPEAHDSRVIWVRSSEPGPGARELLLLFTYQFTCVCVLLFYQQLG